MSVLASHRIPTTRVIDFFNDCGYEPRETPDGTAWTRKGSRRWFIRAEGMTQGEAWKMIRAVRAEVDRLDREAARVAGRSMSRDDLASLMQEVPRGR